MRLPRKRKKQVKKIVARNTAVKISLAAIATAQAMAQNAIITATQMPWQYHDSIVEKTTKVAVNLINCTKTVRNIMTEPPNSWRDFVK